MKENADYSNERNPDYMGFLILCFHKQIPQWMKKPTADRKLGTEQDFLCHY